MEIKEIKFNYCFCGTPTKKSKSAAKTIKEFERMGFLIRMVFPNCGDCDNEARKVYKGTKV